MNRTSRWLERVPAPWRQILTYGVLGAVALWFGHEAVVALMSGEARGRRGAVYLGVEEPVMFWFNVAIDAFVAAMCLIGLVRIAIRDGKRLSGS